MSRSGRSSQATGQSEFCETFLDEVRVPVANRLGAENEGWAVTNSTLSSERGVVIVELAERFMRNGIGACRDDVRAGPTGAGAPLSADDGGAASWWPSATPRPSCCASC